MNFDDGLIDQKLSLDITPLVDIIFLLVMFFAVSTSFISGDDLQKLKSDVINFSTSSTQFESQLTKANESINLLETQLASAKIDYTELQSKARKFELKTNQLQTELSRTTLSRDELSTQLINTQSEAEQRQQKEQLLNSLLAEQQQNTSQLQKGHDELQEEKTQLANQLAMMQALVEDKEVQITKSRTSHASTLSTLESQLSAATQAVERLNQSLAAQQNELSQANATNQALSAQEVLLQKLLAEKAAELSGMAIRLESAETAKANAEKQLTENTDTEKSSREQLLAQMQQSQTQILALQTELEKYRQLANLDREQIQRALDAQQQLNDGMTSYLENNSIDITRDQQKLTLQLSDRILFASGSPRIKSDGLEVLRELGEILKKRMGELEVQIGGHTDNIPVGSSSGPLSNNWGLSAARAVNVVRYFETELDIDPDRMAAVGYGEHRPISENNTATGRSRNRRIEIVLIPR